MIRIVLAEDQAMVRGALAALLALEGDIDVVAQAADGDAAMQAVIEYRPDLLVTDIEMPGKSGLDLARTVKEMRDGGEPVPKVVILTTFARSGFLRRALDAGVQGYLLKDAPATELADALRRVHVGGRAVDPELAAEAWGATDPLTDRERQVLKMAGDGASGADIAATLGLSEGTVRNYLSEAIGKLGATNRVEAARIARENGWL